MAVRLKIRIRVNDLVVEETALLNSGYEAPTPQLLIPITTAKKLGLWPPRENAHKIELDTAGGSTKT